MSKARILLITLATTSFVVASGCKFFRMDVTDNIRVENRSDLKLDLLVNFDYPDTTLARARVNTYVDPRDHGSLKLVNREWANLFQERAEVTVFFAEWQPTEFYRQRPRGPQRVYLRLTLTKERLDSLGWVIIFTPPSGGGMN